MFNWDMIGVYEAEIEGQAFTFTIKREGKEPRWIRVSSPYVSSLSILVLNIILILHAVFVHGAMCVTG